MKKNKGFTLIELLAVIIVIIVILAITIPIVSNMIETVRKEAFKATAYSISDSGRFLMANDTNVGYEEFYYLDGKEYNADDLKLDYTGDGPKTGVVILNERKKVALAIHNGTYCAIKSANENKVTINETTPEDCTAYNIITTCDTWEQIAIKYDVSLGELLTANNETDSNSSTCGRDIKIPVSSSSSGGSYAGGDGSTVYYKTYYTVGYVSSSSTLPLSYEYTIKLGVLPLNISDIEVTKVTAQSVFESLDDFKRYITKKNMGEVIWPGEEPVAIDLDQASVFKDHAATSSNISADDVSVSCDTEACFATVSATVDNLTNVSPNTIEENLIAYTPIKFTVEFNGTPDACTVKTSLDENPGTLAGTGTNVDPYLIESIEDLVALSNSVNAGNTYSGQYISFTNSFDFNNSKSYENYGSTAYGDINGNGTVEGLLTELTTGAGFIPIGNSTTKFSGKILGNTNCIFDLYVNRPTTPYVGFIGYNNSGDITALSLNNINVTGSDYTGGFVGYNYNGSITETSISGSVVGANYTGLITGYFESYADSNKISSFMVEGNITGANYVGGAIGLSTTYDATNTISGINKVGSITSTGINVGRISGGHSNLHSSSHLVSALSSSDVTVNGSTITSTATTSINGSSISNMSNIFNDINLAEVVLDTYIGGDNDGNGYYWDYDVTGQIVRKSVSDYPLTFGLAGAGTVADPYLIGSYDDLRQASLKLGSAYKLTSNIDLAGLNFYMLGSYLNRFSGNFNGDIKTISNLEINASSGAYVGFIGFSSYGDITSTNFVNTDIISGNCTGGIVGYNYNGSITEVNLKGSVVGGDYTGLIAGYFESYDDSNKITSFMVEGNVTGANYVGGAIGLSTTYHVTNTVSGINKGGIITSTGANVGRISGGYSDLHASSHLVSTLSSSTVTINGSTVSSTATTGINGSNIANISNIFNDINLAEVVLDTYIGGDNDGNGYYWDYDATGKVVRKNVNDYPLTFSLAGAGTVADPYLIGSYADLRQASLKVTSAYKLTSNIDLAGLNFYMLGSYLNRFSGNFNGDIKIISNLEINASSGAYVGFIGFSSYGDVTSTNFVNTDIVSGNCTGGIIGYNYNGSITEVNINGSVIGTDYTGLIAGYFESVDDHNKISSFMIEGNVTGANYVGGAIGLSTTYHVTNTVSGINKGGSIVSTGANVGRISGGYSDLHASSHLISTLSSSTVTINGSTVSSTATTGINGSNIADLNNIFNDINLAEVVLDTYIGGDNDGNGYYWDYDATGKVVRKNISDYPLTFSLAGAGTAADPYLIGSYADLRQASLKVNSVYKLTSNIDLSGLNFYMLGSYLNRFSGKFNGDIKTISNLKINASSGAYVGFIGFSSYGDVTSANFVNTNITSGNCTGGIIGYNYNGSITEVNINGSVVGADYVGLIAGYFESVDDANKISSFMIEGNVTGANYVGGAIGVSTTYHVTNTISGINKGGSIVSTGASVGRFSGGYLDLHASSHAVGTLSSSSVTINGSTVSSTATTGINGSNVANLNNIFNDINLAEVVLDTYIGGDNDSNGYYWDYDATGQVIRKNVNDYPLTFSLAGAGTVADPYLIGSYADLRQASLKVTSAYKLNSNIDLLGLNFYMLGSYMNRFTGNFNGNAKTISNLEINASNGAYIGFIGFNNGGNLTATNFENIDIVSGNYTGGIFGFNYNGSLNDIIVNGTISGFDYVGLIAGYFESVDDANQISSFTVEGNVTGSNYVGGAIGVSTTYHVTNTIAGINKGGSITSTGLNKGRILGGYINVHASAHVLNLSAVNSITLNGSTIISTDALNINGLDIASSDLSNTVTYTDRGFNFTDEALEYIWYLDGSTAKFRAGVL